MKELGRRAKALKTRVAAVIVAILALGLVGVLGREFEQLLALIA